MKQALTLLLATGAISLAGAAFAGTAPSGAHAFVFADPATGPGAALLRVSGDDDQGEGEDGEGWFGSNSAGDDGEDDDEACEDDDDEGGCTANGAGNAAPAGSVAPPKNGLFTDGTAPQVKTN